MSKIQDCIIPWWEQFVRIVANEKLAEHRFIGKCCFDGRINEEIVESRISVRRNIRPDLIVMWRNYWSGFTVPKNQSFCLYLL